MKNKNIYRPFFILAVLIFIFMECPQVLGSKKGEETLNAGRENRVHSPIIVEKGATVGFVNWKEKKMVVNDELFDIPQGAPNLQPGDIIEMQLDKKSGKIVKITKVGVQRDKHQPFNGSGDKMRKKKASKVRHGQILKVDGKWKNY